MSLVSSSPWEQEILRIDDEDDDDMLRYACQQGLSGRKRSGVILVRRDCMVVVCVWGGVEWGDVVYIGGGSLSLAVWGCEG